MSPHHLLSLLILFLSFSRIQGGIFDRFLGRKERENTCQSPCVPGSEDIMKPKAHGTSNVPVQLNLRWGCSETTADRICNYNRVYAEYSNYWATTSFLRDVAPMIETKEPVHFYDSDTGKLLFRAPIGRTWEEFLAESKTHGWPSFRDEEVNWDVVRVLPGGETVSVDGTHLGHNIPDRKGNRFCINLVCIAGQPVKADDRRT